MPDGALDFFFARKILRYGEGVIFPIPCAWRGVKDFHAHFFKWAGGEVSDFSFQLVVLHLSLLLPPKNL